MRSRVWRSGTRDRQVSRTCCSSQNISAFSEVRVLTCIINSSILPRWSDQRNRPLKTSSIRPWCILSTLDLFTSASTKEPMTLTTKPTPVRRRYKTKPHKNDDVKSQSCSLRKISLNGLPDLQQRKTRIIRTETREPLELFSHIITRSFTNTDTAELWSLVSVLLIA